MAATGQRSCQSTRLDITARWANKCGVTPRAENFYATWRRQCRAVNELRDGQAAPPEKLLQAIWQHQRLKRDQLKTADGKNLRVLHPGFISTEGGPDFRGAVLQWGEEKPVSGDVEIDLIPPNWHAHGHDRNPAFHNVILHVVWTEGQNPKSRAIIPPVTLPLQNVLDAPLAKLALALENEASLPAALRGQCASPLRELPAPQLEEILHAAAKVRFQNKAAALLARAKQSGWEQALWENLFRGIGYKNNIWPMHTLAETKSRWMRGVDTTFEIQTRLLGVSGLLPADLPRPDKGSDSFLRRAWDLWWRDRDEFESCILPREIWKFHGLRPANHPQRRLALAAHWLAAENLVSNIEAWSAAKIPAIQPADPQENPATHSGALVDSFHKIFQVEYDEYWSWHWTFKSARLVKPLPLLGAARSTDLAVNVVLPWLWVRAKEGGNEKFQLEMERRFFAWPAAEDNSVLKLARQRLLGTAGAKSLSGAARQQGLMQIVRDFCEHSNAICADCRFPELVQCLKSKIQS